MDKEALDFFEFMDVVQDIFDECETIEVLQARSEKMIKAIKQLELQTVGFRKTMGME